MTPLQAERLVKAVEELTASNIALTRAVEDVATQLKREKDNEDRSHP